MIIDNFWFLENFEDRICSFFYWCVCACVRARARVRNLDMNVLEPLQNYSFFEILLRSLTTPFSIPVLPVLLIHRRT